MPGLHHRRHRSGTSKDQQDWEDWVNQSNQHQDGNLPVEREEIDLKYRPVGNMTTLMTQYYGVS